MLATVLSRSFQKVFELRKCSSKLSCITVSQFCGPGTMNMDRIEKILMADKDIEKKIMALRCEVSDVEAKILDSVLIERLERENKELEEEIKKYKEELISLEKLNGRAQVVNKVTLASKGNIPCQTKDIEVALKAPSKTTPSNESPKPVVKDSKPPESVAKKGKKDGKKSDKPEVNKNEKGDSGKKAGGGSEELPVDIGRLDLKVGKILHIERHPDADSLYVEKVDIGKEEPITVVSGLVKHISISEMQDSLVIILCNLKPAKMRGVTSEGMVMCASVDGFVEVLRPPPDSLPGEPVLCPGYSSNPDSILNPKKKIFETVAPDLKTDNEMFATYKGARWSIGSKGFIKANSLKGANIK